MFHAITWFIVVLLLAAWSAIVWAVHAVSVWAVTQAGTLGGAAGAVGSLSVPEWLAPWVPPSALEALSGVARDLAPLVGGVLQAVPSFAGALDVLAWLVWGVGLLLLLVLGAAAHLLIAGWRRRGGAAGTPGPGRPLAA